MRAKWWVLFIGLNIIVSVLTTLAVLSLKGEPERVVVVNATSSAALPERVPTATSVGQPVESKPSPTAPPSIEYTVQPGDTLGGIALANEISLENLLLANNLKDDDIITPGQVLVIPFGEVVTPTPVTPSPVAATPTPASPTAFPTETPTPPGPVQVRIQEVLAPGTLAREGVVLINRGRTVNLQEWTLGAAGGEVAYVFPRLTLAQGVPVTVYTIGGDDSPQALHWGQEEAQWGESGIIIELRDGEGDLVATYPVP
jgi:LysM repeat protein